MNNKNPDQTLCFNFPLSDTYTIFISWYRETMLKMHILRQLKH